VTAGARGVRYGPFDHRRVEVESDDIEAVVARQPDRQSSWTAPHLEDASARRSGGCDVGGDAAEERTEEAVAERVVEGGVTDQEASRGLPSHRPSDVPADHGGERGRGSQHDHERSGSSSHRALNVRPTASSRSGSGTPCPTTPAP
jgi:hypothetical protein